MCELKPESETSYFVSKQWGWDFFAYDFGFSAGVLCFASSCGPWLVLSRSWKIPTMNPGSYAMLHMK